MWKCSSTRASITDHPCACFFAPSVCRCSVQLGDHCKLKDDQRLEHCISGTKRQSLCTKERFLVLRRSGPKLCELSRYSEHCTALHSPLLSCVDSDAPCHAFTPPSLPLCHTRTRHPIRPHSSGSPWRCTALPLLTSLDSDVPYHTFTDPVSHSPTHVQDTPSSSMCFCSCDLSGCCVQGKSCGCLQALVLACFA